MMCFSSQNGGLFEKRLLWLAGFESGGPRYEDEGAKSQEPRAESQEPRNEGLGNQERVEGDEGVDTEADVPRSGEELAEDALEASAKPDARLMDQFEAVVDNPKSSPYSPEEVQSVLAERLDVGGPIENFPPLQPVVEENAQVVTAQVAAILNERGPENPS